jgi:hypothetical protein
MLSKGPFSRLTLIGIPHDDQVALHSYTFGKNYQPRLHNAAHHCEVSHPRLSSTFTTSLQPPVAFRTFASHGLAMEISILRLNLVVSSHNLRVAWRCTRLFGSGSHTWTLCLTWWRWCRSIASLPTPIASLCRTILRLRWQRGRPIVSLSLSLLLLRAVVSSVGLVPDVIVRDSSSLGVLDGLVVVISFRVAGDDVPSVDEAGYIAQQA